MHLIGGSWVGVSVPCKNLQEEDAVWNRDMGYGNMIPGSYENCRGRGELQEFTSTKIAWMPKSGSKKTVLSSILPRT